MKINKKGVILSAKTIWLTYILKLAIDYQAHPFHKNAVNEILSFKFKGYVIGMNTVSHYGIVLFTQSI